MRTDDDVNRAVSDPLHDLPLLSGRQEPGQHLDSDGVRREPLLEVHKVLLGKERRRHEHHDLLPILDRLEHGTQCDLGLAESHIPEDQPVHRPFRLHVSLHVGDRE